MKYLLAITILVLAGCQTTTTAPQVSTPTSTAAMPAGSILSLLNRERAAQGRGPVSEDARLSRAARDHAQDMVSNDYFSHTGRNGSSFSARAQAAGYTCAAAENIAFGQQSEADVMTAWMNSSGHRRNILLADATEFGIGRVGTMWVLMMGRGC